LIALLVLASLLAEPAGDLGTSPLAFTFDGCSEAEAREIEEVVRADVAWAPGDPSIALTLRCQPAGVLLSLFVDDVPTAERFVDLARTASEARLRTVALIATELVLVGRSAPPTVRPERAAVDRGPAPPSSRGDGQPATAVAAAIRADHVAAVDVRPSILVTAGASLHGVVPRAPVFALGGRLRGDFFSWGGIAADVAGLYQGKEVAPGALTAMGGAAALVVETRARMAGGALRAGLGARVLGLRVSGSTSMSELRATAAWGAAAGPLARIAGAYEGERTVAEVALEGGWCGPEVVGTVAGASSIGVGGWWGGLSFAAGWRLGRDRDRADVSSVEEDPRPLPGAVSFSWIAEH